ncbi:MAG: mechanosensitive ion channel domain-containing protein, partial [Planctomycetaceae bacterium]
TKVSEIQATQKSTTTDYDELQNRYQKLRDRDQRAAGSAALGLRLRDQRDQLVDPEDLRHEIAVRLETVEQVRLTGLDRHDQLDALSELDDVVDAYVEKNRTPLTTSDMQWRQMVSAAYLQRKEFLSELDKAYETYSNALDELETQQEAYASLTSQVMTFIDERVLWIRSHQPLSITGVTHEQSTLVWLVSGEAFQESIRVLRADAWKNPGLYGLFLVAVVVLQLRRRRQRRRLDEMAQLVTSRSNLDINPTLQALAVTMLLCVLWPGVVTFLGHRLQNSPEANDFTRRLGQNFYVVAMVVAIIEFTRHFVRVDGLADVHFDWGERIRGRLLSWVRWLNLCGLPLLFLVAILNARESEYGGDYLERIVFASELLLLAWALRDLMHPRSGILVEWSVQNPEGWVQQMRPAWSLAIISVPIVLCGLALFGYYYTAQRLTSKLIVTLVLTIAAIVVRGILARWLNLRHRRLAIEQLRARRAALAEATSTAEESVASVLDVTEQQADLSESSAQSRRLIATSLTVLMAAAVWFVWADVLPALNYFNSHPVWSTRSTVANSTGTAMPPSPAAMATPPADSGSKPNPLELGMDVQVVTWADLIRAVVVVVLTITAARNVPGLLEITVLERLPLDAAARYAVQVFARYAIVLLGVVIVSNLLGLEWSKVQWLVAALTFGLAFGLQEIFANFISGLIILSEQPVRLGDVVTIDNVSGVVSRIRMRSTTVTDWDRKEYIVPNKEFITGKLLNWTLTDSMTRIVVPVGVGYDSNPNHVRSVLLAIAAAHPNVLKDPPPNVAFDSFGDSSLNFTLRVYVATLDKRLPTIHDLHTTICLRFREERIEIPYPQRDLNLRSLPKAVVSTLQEMGESAA